MDKYRVVIADDHAIYRQGMKLFIEKVPGLEVVGEASDGVKLLELLKQKETDMVLLDIAMPGLKGMEAAKEIKKKYPVIAVLMLTMHKTKEYLYQAFSTGARGYLLKEDSDVELLTAIETIRKGDIYVSDLLASELSEDVGNKKTKGNIPAISEPLSTREREVLKLIAEENLNKEIAHLLGISTRTVESHRANILRKLGKENTVGLVKYALRIGLTE